MCWYKILYQVEPVVWTSITESRKGRVVMRFVHTTGKTWYSLVPTHYVCNKFIQHFNRTHFKQITRVKIRLTNLYNTLGETTFCAWRHVICCHSFICFVYVAYIDVFSPHSNDMTSWQNSLAKKTLCNVAPFFYHHSVVIQHLVSDRLFSLNSKENVKDVR